MLLPGFALVLITLGCGADAEPSRSFRLGATTTIEDSGLLTELQQGFAADHPNLRMVTLTGGTGEVLELGRRKDVDVTITHDPAAESVFVAQGHGVSRRELMYNDFVVAGPAADPVHLRGVSDAADGFRRLAGAAAPFVSRGDDSGTHRKELFLWKQAGSTVPTQKPAWYIEAGVGMGEALRVASTRKAYLLTDRATFLTLQHDLELVVLLEGDPRLRNRYGLVRMAVVPNTEAADSFAVWITSPRGYQVISTFGVSRYGRQLFTPVQ